MTELNQATKTALFEVLLRLGDDQLVLAQRLGEWCGIGPELEEDIALTNIALDCVGQAEMILGLAGEIEGEGRDADRLAYHRDEYEFRNLQLLERPRGHFGDTIVRQFLYDAFAYFFYKALTESSYQPLADIAAKAIKEITYHLRHSREWLIRLGDGTEESHEKVQLSLNEQWPFTGELFFTDQVDATLIAEGMIPDAASMRADWDRVVNETLAQATLKRPEDPAHFPCDARLGRHSEYLGHMLSNMQILARSHPDAKW